MPDPPAPHDVRLRKVLGASVSYPTWPVGFVWRSFRPDDAPALHGLLTEVFDDGSDGPFETWRTRLFNDPEFDPALCFLVFGQDGDLAAAALCWNTGFVKDLAVRRESRRLGLGRALMLHAFAAFQDRGAVSVDLKTNLVANAAAVRLYDGLGMVRVEWDG